MHDEEGEDKGERLAGSCRSASEDVTSLQRTELLATATVEQLSRSERTSSITPHAAI